ncbi:MAG: transposase [Pseudonocardiaceae bacterium]
MTRGTWTPRGGIVTSVAGCVGSWCGGDGCGVVKLVTEVLDTVRRQVWQSARKLRDQSIAKKFTGARWALLKNPSI